MQSKSKRLAAVMGAALALSGIGATAAIGASGSSPVPAATVQTPAPAATAPPTVDHPEANAPDRTSDPVETNAPDQTADPVEQSAPDSTSAVDGDTLQQGEQTTPDTGPAAASETTGDNPASENAPEQVEPNDPSLPGGGHQDAPGQNVDHQFQGVE
jgi:hypothetical protein